AEECLRLAERQPHQQLAMRGHLAMEVTLLHLAEFAAAVGHFEKALLLYGSERGRDDSFRHTQNPRVAMLCYAAWSLWFLGLPDQALGRIREALSFARELSEPHGLAHSLFFAAVLYQLRHEGRLAQEHADAAAAVSGQHGLVMYQAMATVMQGWALSKQGRPEEAIKQMRQGLAALQATGTELVRPHFLALLAEAFGKAGQPGEGLRVLEEALARANRTGERYYEAELYRLKGELLLMQPASRSVSHAGTGGEAVVDDQANLVANAAASFNQAIQIARQQKARSRELGAAMSAARLYQNKARREAGRGLRDVLAEVYNRFTEGFDTMDLREAKALLDSLS